MCTDFIVLKLFWIRSRRYSGSKRPQDKQNLEVGWNEDDASINNVDVRQDFPALKNSKIRWYDFSSFVSLIKDITRILSVPNWNSPVNRLVLRNFRSYSHHGRLKGNFWHKVTWRGWFLARKGGEMKPKTRLNNHILFSVWQTEFEEKCARINVYQLSTPTRSGDVVP